MKCPKCGSDKLSLVKSGPHNKLICSKCMAFVKFLSASEYKNYMAIQEQSSLVLKPGDFVQIADEMMRRGIRKENILSGNFEDWTNTLVDVLEHLYGIESRIRKAIENN